MRPALRPFVKQLWASTGAGPVRERVLPTGVMHIVFRFGAQPVRFFKDAGDRLGFTLGQTLLGGARETFYQRSAPGHAESVGAQLWPGAAELLFGVPASALAGAHHDLTDVWPAAKVLHAMLAESANRLETLETFLLARLPRVRSLDPAVAFALQRFHCGERNVQTVIDDIGYSHRHFIGMFDAAVGLTPKRYCRVLRFQDALTRLSHAPLSDVSLDAGYADQSHMNRDFHAFTGMSPTQYKKRAPVSLNHVSE